MRWIWQAEFAGREVLSRRAPHRAPQTDKPNLGAAAGIQGDPLSPLADRQMTSAARSQRISDRVARHVMGHIKQHRLQPGANLPSEVQISASLGVSRGIVRE